MIEVKNWHRCGWKYGHFNRKTGKFLVSQDKKTWLPGAELKTVKPKIGVIKNE